MNVIVFTGPTLAPQEVRQVIDAECLPPVSQGDVYRAALRRPPAIGIIDGYFDRVPSVWHKEILWAMSQGIHVFGSASMGALRAAELAPFGMVGVGAVFEAYRDGVLEDDDEVAVAHGPSAKTFRFCTDAMVNIRATLAKAVAEGVIEAETRDSLVRIAKGLFYPERTWARVLERASAERVSAAEIDTLRQWLPSGAVNRKREDALAMLRAMGEFLSTDPGPKRVSVAFEETLYWEEAVHASREVAFEAEGSADRLVLDELRRDPEALLQAEAAALGWWLASEDARREGVVPEAVGLLERSREFCERHGLADSAAVADWLARNRCSREDLDYLLSERALALSTQQRAPDALATFLLDYLRWTGAYAGLLDRARSINRP
jgi:hypothetical protein